MYIVIIIASLQVNILQEVINVKLLSPIKLFKVIDCIF